MAFGDFRTSADNINKEISSVNEESQPVGEKSPSEMNSNSPPRLELTPPKKDISSVASASNERVKTEIKVKISNETEEIKDLMDNDHVEDGEKDISVSLLQTLNTSFDNIDDDDNSETFEHPECKNSVIRVYELRKRH